MAAEQGDSGLTILHVDDEPDVAELTADMLEQESERFDVVTAPSAAEGLAVLDERDVDCVVSDYEMPGMDGIELLETVREDRPDLPFILFTGRGSEEVASEAISAGVTEYLQKDVGLAQYEVLAHRVSNAVERHRAHRRLAVQKGQYKRLFEDAPVMYAVTRNRDGGPVVDECNRWFLDRLGYGREAVIGEPLTDFYTEESAERLLEGGGYDRAMDGEFETEERAFVTADGEVLETVLRAVPRHDHDGDIVGTLTLYVESADDTARPADPERAEQ